MAELSRFFNSVNGDRRYLAEEFAEYFKQFLTNGVYHTDFIPTLATKTSGIDMNVYVEPGQALINGYMYENTVSKILQVSAADPTLDRIDRIVVRLDRNQDVRNITTQIIKGTLASKPVVPVLTRTNYIYELSLAQIYVTRGAVHIGAESITDERENKEVCGLVRSLITDRFSVIRDDATNKEFTMGVENGLVFIQEV